MSYLEIAKRALQRPSPEPVAAPRARPAGEVGQALGGVEPASWPVTTAELLSLPLADFATAGLVVEVRSKVLGELVLFASDNALLDPGERRPVYRAAELRELVGLKPAELRTVHRVKRTFRGTVADR